MFQLGELLKVLQEERAKFKELAVSHARNIATLINDASCGDGAWRDYIHSVYEREVEIELLPDLDKYSASLPNKAYPEYARTTEELRERIEEAVVSLDGNYRMIAARTLMVMSGKVELDNQNQDGDKDKVVHTEVGHSDWVEVIQEEIVRKTLPGFLGDIENQIGLINLQGRGDEIYAFISTVADVLGQESSNPEAAVRVGKESLLSMSLNLPEIIRVLGALPTLSDFQLNALMEVYEEESNLFERLIDEHAHDIAKLICARSYGCVSWRKAFLAKYGNSHVAELVQEACPVSQESKPTSKTHNKVTPLSLEDIQHFLVRLSVDSSSAVQELVAQAMFMLASKVDEDDTNPDAYASLIELFKDNEHPVVQEIVANAMIIRANECDKDNTNPDAYFPLIAQFESNMNIAVQKIVARGMFNRAYDIAKHDLDADAYLPIIERYKDNPHEEVQVVVARAMLSRANMIAVAYINPGAYLPLIAQFSDSSFASVQKVVVSARENRVGWLIVAGNNEQAIREGDSLLSRTDIEVESRLVMTFLLWLAIPCMERRDTVENMISTLAQGTRTSWTFDEFSGVLGQLGDDDRAFAELFIDQFECE